MKTFAKTIVCIAVAGITFSAFAGPHAPAPRHYDRGGNDGVRLATDIVSLVGVSLDVLGHFANPQPVVVQRQVVVAPPQPVNQQFLVTQPVVTQTVMIPQPQPVVVEKIYYQPRPFYQPQPQYRNPHFENRQHRR